MKIIFLCILAVAMIGLMVPSVDGLTDQEYKELIRDAEMEYEAQMSSKHATKYFEDEVWNFSFEYPDSFDVIVDDNILVCSDAEKSWTCVQIIYADWNHFHPDLISFTEMNELEIQEILIEKSRIFWCLSQESVQLHGFQKTIEWENYSDCFGFNVLSKKISSESEYTKYDFELLS